jgi:hypothetical protein
VPYFIEVDDGWVNLDHVETVSVSGRASRGDKVIRFEKADGISLGIRTGSLARVDMDELLAPIISAAPGCYAWVIWTCVVWDEENQRETGAVEVNAVRVPVIAWRLLYGGATPLLADEPSDGSMVCLELPDGSLEEQAVGNYRDIEEAKLEAFNRHKAANKSGTS